MGRYYGPEEYPSVSTILDVLAKFQGIPRHILLRKARLGTAVHLYTAMIDKGFTWIPGGIPRLVEPYVRGWQMYKADHIERIIWVEYALVSGIFKFGGKIDRLAILKGKRFPSVLDLKVTADVNRFVNLQMAPYRLLVDENYKKKIDLTTYAIQLFPDDYRIHPIEDYYDGLQGFFNALWLYHYLNGGR